MIEFERTFLAGWLPDDLEKCTSKVIIDLYVENGTDHADLRIRKSGEKYEITRKTPVSEGDVSIQTEVTIPITETEFDSLSIAKARKIEKLRYYYSFEGKTCEIDLFQGDLRGLALVDFEFESESEMSQFTKPDFCLVDITQEKFIAGGVLAGKRLGDIEPEFVRFGYSPLFLS